MYLFKNFFFSKVDKPEKVGLVVSVGRNNLFLNSEVFLHIIWCLALETFRKTIQSK